MLGMREKVTAAVAEVKEEVRAGRLRWCYKDIMRHILPHPRKQHVDDVLANIGDDTALDEGDKATEEAEGGDDGGSDANSCDDEAMSEGGSRKDEDDDDDEDWGNERDLEEWRAVEAPRHADGSGASAVAGVSPALPPGVSEAQSKEARDCSDVMRVYENIAAELRCWGDVKGGAYMELQRDKERKRTRELSREESGVLRALLKLEDDQRAAERKQKRLLDEAHQRKLELSGLCRDVKQAKRLLQEQKARILDAEATLHVKQQVRRFSPEELGSGCRSCGGGKGKKNRIEVLKRMSGLGAGLSAAQKAEFPWFCDAWDAAGIEDFGDDWPDTFSTWIHNVLEERESAVVTAFSTFVYSETRRRLAGAVALALPGARAA